MLWLLWWLFERLKKKKQVLQVVFFSKTAFFWSIIAQELNIHVPNRGPCCAHNEKESFSISGFLVSFHSLLCFFVILLSIRFDSYNHGFGRLRSPQPLPVLGVRYIAVCSSCVSFSIPFTPFSLLTGANWRTEITERIDQSQARVTSKFRLPSTHRSFVCESTCAGVCMCVCVE